MYLGYLWDLTYDSLYCKIPSIQHEYQASENLQKSPNTKMLPPDIKHHEMKLFTKKMNFHTHETEKKKNLKITKIQINTKPLMLF